MVSSKSPRGSRKNSKPKCKECGKEKEISFEGDGIQYPVFSCPEHGPDERNEWALWWEKYSKRGLKREFWLNKKDRPSCVVSYFCHKYQEFFGFPYTMDYSNPIPYKNKEFTMARRIITMFGDDFLQIPNYILWVFKKRVRSKKYPLSSLGFFASNKFVNEYRMARANNQKPKRSTKLPAEFLDWCRKNYPNVVEYNELESYNDLNMLVVLGEAGGSDEKMVVQEARNIGILPKTGPIQLEE
jgi:hypothetical protein